MGNLIDMILDALFPEDCCCIFCRKEALLNGYGVCEDCAGSLFSAPAIRPPEPLSAAHAAFWYTEKSSAPIKRLKYSNERWLARRLSPFLSVPADWKADSILPIPLHPKRERKRGFNQSVLLAQGLTSSAGLPMEQDLLLRQVNTTSQAELSREARLHNLTGAFCCPKPERIEGRSFILIDDVITTGSTMAECARTLKRAGASRIYGLALCFQAGSEPAGSPLYFR